ncbi:FabD/lysophospholipase-like protein [Massarina eburnea CBS 473.64]|uniref:FabD/lysophospholipase-like protein n=1 Tax=Massarina eburnea CBS 473.64 TaxID=1395130 RepID=A0A6A6RRJ5_9PLEO|nr:FabD/lysophospholipase-like protein [Massarina eburnea CBS 473.64]
MLVVETRSSNIYTPRSAHVMNISAKTSKALEELRSRYITLLQKGNYQNYTIADLCYSANARRQYHDEFRISVVGNPIEDLVQKLESAHMVKKVAKATQDITVFLFSGQANLYRGIGAELFSTAPVFQEAVLKCSEILRQLGFEGVEHFISNNDRGQKGVGDEEEVLSQCACFVVQYALAKLWQSWEVEPEVVIGHSMGAYAAFVTSGTLSLEDALLLIAKRAQLMVSHCT